MAQKSEFSEEEWDRLRKGATGAGLLVSVSDRSLLDSFKEAGALAKHLTGGRAAGESELVRELSGERGLGFGMTSSPQEIESETLDALRGAVTTLQAKAPDEVEPYKAFVLELAASVGKAAGGGDEAEAEALEKIRTALA
jgi:hypothetical protein